MANEYAMFSLIIGVVSGFAAGYMYRMLEKDHPEMAIVKER